jgi:hypothetical protein
MSFSGLGGNGLKMTKHQLSPQQEALRDSLQIPGGFNQAKLNAILDSYSLSLSISQLTI